MNISNKRSRITPNTTSQHSFSGQQRHVSTGKTKLLSIMIQHIRNTFNLKFSLPVKKKLCKFIGSIETQYSIKFLHLVKTLPMLLLFIQLSVSVYFGKSFYKYTEHACLHFCNEIQKNTLLVVWRYAMYIGRQAGRPPYHLSSSCYQNEKRFSTSITKSLWKTLLLLALKLV